MKSQRHVMEAYRKIGDPEDRFDIDYWQAQGPQAIFRAAEEMVRDYLRIRYGSARLPRMAKRVEAYRRIDDE